MRLRNITLKNFRSIGDEDGAGIEIPLARINYIIGPNGAGKSNIVAGLETIAAILAGDKYEPKPADHFDRDPAREMELGATMDLSNEERMRLLIPLAKQASISMKDLSNFPIFRAVSYSVVFANGEKQSEKISTGIQDGVLYTLSEARRDEDKVILKYVTLELTDDRKEIVGETSSSTITQFPDSSELVGYASPPLLDALKQHFGRLRALDMDRKIAGAVPAREVQGISSNGGNLPAELNGLDRDKQVEFDEYMKAITHGDPVGTEPHLRGSEFVLKIMEAGLGGRGTHADLGSGQEQSLILGWHIFNASGTILVVREPEIHLHAERQKQILQRIRLDDRGLQFVIETHSPVFLGTAEGENVLLATKSVGHTTVAKVAPENMRLIREELGISHADALYNTRILFVEGESEFAALPMFWRTLYPGSDHVPAFFSLGGSGNTKHLRLVLEYLKADDRSFFAILDNHDDAKAHVESRQYGKLLGGRCHFLQKSFEDEFTCSQIAAAFGKMAADEGTMPFIDASALDTARKNGLTADHLKNLWASEVGSKFDKVRLAELLGRLPGDEIPSGIKGALDAAAACFGGGDGVAGRNQAQAAGNDGGGG